MRPPYVRHVRQKELAPSAKVRRTTPEAVRVPPRHLLVTVIRVKKSNATNKNSAAPSVAELCPLLGVTSSELSEAHHSKATKLR
jgi:hypothetical protein